LVLCAIHSWVLIREARAGGDEGIGIGSCDSRVALGGAAAGCRRLRLGLQVIENGEDGNIWPACDRVRFGGGCGLRGRARGWLDDGDRALRGVRRVRASGSGARVARGRSS
jgi:hypothetical protein